MTSEELDKLVRLGAELERQRIIMMIHQNKYKEEFNFESLIDLIKAEQK